MNRSKLFVFTVIFSLMVTPAWTGEVEAPDIDIPDFKVAGDGKTPTFLQFLDAKGLEAKPTRDLISSTPKGDAIYSFPLELPAALLKPKLGLKTALRAA